MDKIINSHRKWQYQHQNGCQCSTIDSHLHLSDQNIVQNDIQNTTGQCSCKAICGGTVYSDKICKQFFTDYDGSCQKPPTCVCFTPCNCHGGCTEHGQNCWEIHKNHQGNEASKQDSCKRADRKGALCFLFSVSSNVQSCDSAAAGSKYKCNSGQYIYNRINNVNRSQCIGSDICRNKNTINNGIDCVK